MIYLMEIKVATKGVSAMPVQVERVVELLEAALAADYTRLRRVGNRIARALAEAGDLESAHRLRALLRKREVPLRASGYMEAVPIDAKSRQPLVEEQDWPSGPIFLDEAAHNTLGAFLTDVRHAHELSAKGLASNLCMLLSGPPGTGKSLLASHVAAQLDRPFYVARLDSVISSLLGDTAKNIRNVFDFIPRHDAVLLLDEMDAIAKLRDDRHELGELKRVVNTVIQGLDSLEETTVVVAATNHPHLLDSAIWRRFPYKIELQLPNKAVREDMWKHFLYADGDIDEVACSVLATLSADLSGADIETIALALRRHAALSITDVDPGAAGLAVIRTHNNRPNLPLREPLTTEQKRELARTASEKFRVSGADIARVLGVSRQAVYGYLKEEDHAGDPGTAAS